MREKQSFNGHPKKMLVVTTVSATLEAFLLPYAEHYREQGWIVDALAAGASGSERCLRTFDNAWEAKWSRSPLDVSGNMESARRVRELVAEKEYDIVHVHTPVASFVTRAALRNRRSRTRVVYTAHGFHFFAGGPAHKNAVFSMLEKMGGSWTDALVVINREDEAAARRRGIVEQGRIFYMPGIGIDLNRYSADAICMLEVEQLREELKIGPEEFVFLKVAEMIPRKRHQDALRAFAQLDGEGKLILVGDGPLREGLQSLAESLGIQDRVLFLGVRRDVPALMKMANAVMLLSSQEGLPRCVMEAMAMGRAVIGTDVRGTRDLLEKGGGMLAPVGNIESIAFAMKKMRDNKSETIKMGAKGRELVKSYDLQHVIELHDELYAKILRN